MGNSVTKTVKKAVKNPLVNAIAPGTIVHGLVVRKHDKDRKKEKQKAYMEAEAELSKKREVMDSSLESFEKSQEEKRRRQGLGAALASSSETTLG